MLTVNFSPFPALTTPRLLLREITADDAEGIFMLRSSNEVMKYIDRPRAKTIEDALEFIGKIEMAVQENNGINWAITLKENSAFVGSIGLWRIIKEHYRAEIGYMLIPSFQGKGMMQEAMEAVIAYGFNQLNLHSIEANVNPENLASIRLLEKNKFVLEAHFRENYFFEGKFLDSLIFSLLATTQ
jgi:ribosomal-protein-alanine N-acetyltransferase